MWAFVVVVAIYSTLGLAAQLVGLVSEEILAGLFLLCLILVVVVVITQGFRIRPGGKEIGIALGVVVVYVLLGVRMAIPERSHLMEYGILAMLIYEAFTERAANGRLSTPPALAAFLVASAVGLLDECIQIALPNRVFDWEDILFNVLAVLAAVLGLATIRWTRRRSRSGLRSE